MRRRPIVRRRYADDFQQAVFSMRHLNSLNRILVAHLIYAETEIERNELKKRTGLNEKLFILAVNPLIKSSFVLRQWDSRDPFTRKRSYRPNPDFPMGRDMAELWYRLFKEQIDEMINKAERKRRRKK